MTDYYDGPRAGIADFRGTPHAYVSLFDDTNDDYTDRFELRAIDDETLALALEDWATWVRWEDAFHTGLTDLTTHPALPADRARHDELAPLLASRLAALPGPRIVARGTFRPRPGYEHAVRGRSLEVEWTIVAR
jgi:hypothetical protein